MKLVVKYIHTANGQTIEATTEMTLFSSCFCGEKSAIFNKALKALSLPSIFTKIKTAKEIIRSINETA